MSSDKNHPKLCYSCCISDLEESNSDHKWRNETRRKLKTRKGEKIETSVLSGAAVAYVADLFKVPAIFMKAVTDIVDGDKPISEEYLQNVSAVTAALGQAVTQVIHYINGKCISEL